MNLLELPEDILLLILDLLARHNYVQLAYVSRAAHALAMPRLLSHVVLGNPAVRLNDTMCKLDGDARLSQVASFTDSLLTTRNAYADHLKSLTLHRTAIFPMVFGSGPLVQEPRVMVDRASSIRALGEVIRRASNLRRLNIFRVRELLAEEPTFSDVIANHHRLQYLKLDTLNAEWASLLLARMKSSLKELAVRENVHEFDLNSLRPHADTLEVFRIIYFDTILVPPHPGPVWPHLHTLKILCYKVHPPVTSFPQMFPNVRRLTLACTMASLPALRLRIIAQDPAQMRPIAWPSLDVLVLAPAWINLVTPVRFLRLGQAARSESLPPRIFEHLQPVVLSLDVHDQLGWAPSLQSASSCLRRTLRYLHLRRCDGSKYATLETRALNTTRMMDTLRRLADLHLSLIALSMCHAPQTASEDTPENRERIATSVAGLFPTVELVGFGYHGRAPGPRDEHFNYTPTTWYRVRRAQTNGVDGHLVEAAQPGETAAINAYVEGLDRPAA